MLETFIDIFLNLLFKIKIKNMKHYLKPICIGILGITTMMMVSKNLAYHECITKHGTYHECIYQRGEKRCKKCDW